MSDWNDPSAVTAATDAGMARRDTIYRLRGQILSNANDIESLLDTIIARYFGQRQPPAIRKFRSWVLTYVPFRDKVHALKKITAALELAVPEGLFADLDAVIDMRNDLAHSSVVMNPNVPPKGRAPEQYWQLHSDRSRREAAAIDMTKLEGDAGRVVRTLVKVVQVMLDAAALPSGD